MKRGEAVETIVHSRASKQELISSVAEHALRGCLSGSRNSFQLCIAQPCSMDLHASARTFRQPLLTNSPPPTTKQLPSLTRTKALLAQDERVHLEAQANLDGFISPVTCLPCLKGTTTAPEAYQVGRAPVVAEECVSCDNAALYSTREQGPRLCQSAQLLQERVLAISMAAKQPKM
jgi:hypothetical protein